MDINVLGQCALFQGISGGDLESMLRCLAPKECQYKKGEMILCAGEPPRGIGVVVSGGVMVVKEDFWGNRSIMSALEPAEIFGEAFACAQVAEQTVSAVSTGKTRVLFLDHRKILGSCPKACAFHKTLIGNTLRILVQKNIQLLQKLDFMVRKTTREKLLAFLSHQALKQGKRAFDIALNRQELADYLSVDRSAMSQELCKLRDQGVLTFSKNHFELIE